MEPGSLRALARGPLLGFDRLPRQHDHQREPDPEGDRRPPHDRGGPQEGVGEEADHVQREPRGREIGRRPTGRALAPSGDGSETRRGGPRPVRSPLERGCTGRTQQESVVSGPDAAPRAAKRWRTHVPDVTQLALEPLVQTGE